MNNTRDELPPPSIVMLFTKHVLARVPFCKSTLHTMVLRGDFPAPKKVGLRRNAWLSSDVDAWLLSWAAAPKRTVSP
jgi:predicted DNA-binding transcriptional regulator AlpA